MAIAIDANNERLSHTSIFSAAGDFTVIALWRTDGSLSTYQPIISLGRTASGFGFVGKNTGTGVPPSGVRIRGKGFFRLRPDRTPEGLWIYVKERD